MRAVAACLLFLTLSLAGCATPGSTPPPAATGPPAPGFYPQVKLATSMGDVWLEVYDEMVPGTADNFLQYIRNHFYEGTKFHRVIGPAKAPPNGFMIQGGDPNTKDPSKPQTTWGQGDPNLRRIQDEFTRDLRFDRPGVVGMARPREPNSASSQFFITLDAKPELDDAYAVLGRVIRGMEVVRAIGNARTLDTPIPDVPAEDVIITHTEVVAAQRSPADVHPGLAAWTYQATWNASAGRPAVLAVVVQNTGNVRLDVNATMDVPQGWEARNVFPGLPPLSDVPAAFSTRIVPANGSRVFQFIVTPGNDSAGNVPVTVRLRAQGAEASVPLVLHVGPLGTEAGSGDRVTVHYIGMLTDGRLFDADRYAYTVNASIHTYPERLRFNRPVDRYRPLGFVVDDPACKLPEEQRPTDTACVIDGFSSAARGLRVGESRAALIPPDLGYGSAACPPGQSTCLSGKWLVFIVELLSTAPAQA